MKALRLILAAVFAMAGAPDAGAKSRARRSRGHVHVVQKGQTLWEIAKDYGCKVKRLRRANHLKGDNLRIGQKLKVPRCSGRRHVDAPEFIHFVGRGETLSGIAKRYDVSVRHLRRRNRIRGNLIRPGQKLRIIPGTGGRGRPLRGQSIGSPQNGKLMRGVQLPRDRAYYRRRPYRAWGANHTIHYVRRIARIIRRKYRRLHPVAIGDVSKKGGGDLSPHLSHQSGRDVDIGFYFKKKPKYYPKSFIKGNASNLHMNANWTMLRLYAATARSSGGVEKIFMDYKLQKLFYKWALEHHKASKRTLRQMFQYPRGPAALLGIVRHEPGHDDHIHVRFKCPRRDKKCFSY